MHPLSYILRRSSLILASACFIFGLINTGLRIYEFGDYEAYTPIVSTVFLLIAIRYAAPALRIARTFQERVESLSFNERRIIAGITFVFFFIPFAGIMGKILDFGPYTIWLGLPCMLIIYWVLLYVMPTIKELEDHRNKMMQKELKEYESNDKRCTITVIT